MKGQTQLGVAPWVCSAHPSGAGSRSNKAVTPAWPSKTTLHPAGSRGRSVTSAPRWAVGTMQSVGRRAWTHGVSKRRADSGERVMGILVWDTNGASGENRQGGGFRGPPAVSRRGLPSSSPQDNLAEHQASRPSPLLDGSLIIQRSQ